MGILCALAVSLDGLAQSTQEALFPRPFALAVDDLGMSLTFLPSLQNGRSMLVKAVDPLQIPHIQ